MQNAYGVDYNGRVDDKSYVASLICCSVWQCVAVRGSVWQCVAMCGSVWRYSVLQVCIVL